MAVRNLFVVLLIGGAAQMAVAANLVIKPFRVPTGIRGEIVSLQVEADGGVPPYVFEIEANGSPPYLKYSVSPNGLLSIEELNDSVNCSTSGSHSGYRLKVTDSVGASFDENLPYSVWVPPPASVQLKWWYSSVNNKYNADINLGCGSALFVNGATANFVGGNIPSGVDVQYVGPMIMYFTSNNPVSFDLDVEYNVGLHPNSKIGTVRYSFRPYEAVAPTPVPASGAWALFSAACLIGLMAFGKLRRRGG